MQTITIGELINGGADPDGHIYVVRNGDAVLYVGQTSNGITYRWLEKFIGRMFKTVSGQWRGRDALSNLIVDEMPESLSWEIDCYGIKEAAQAYMPAYIEVLRVEYNRVAAEMGVKAATAYDFNLVAWVDESDIMEVEKACIYALKPRLNAQGAR